MEGATLGVEGDLAIIITTSPIRNNPATDVIDLAISSILQQPSLHAAPILIICDGVKLTPDPTSKYKSGIVSPAALHHYQQFKQRLREKYQSDPRIAIEERKEHCGFAENIRHLMAKIPHQFVLIFQHDHVLCRPVDFAAIVAAMKAHPINYVGLMNNSVRKLPYELDQHMGLRRFFSEKVGYQPTHVRHDHGDFTRAVEQHYQAQYGLPLMPLLFWYDKVHVARRSYYLQTVFSPHGFLDEPTQTYVRTATFVEDSFGCFMRQGIHHRPSKFDELAAFILWDAPESAVAHTNGRGFLTELEKQERLQQYLQNRQPSEHSEEEEEGELDLGFLQEQ